MKKTVCLAISVVLVLLVAAAAVVLFGTGDQSNDQSSEEDDGSTVNETTDDADSAETVAANKSEDDENATIVLGTVVTVNGSAITTDPSSAVYASTSSLGYSIMNIARAGTYTISGSADNMQVRVIAGNSDEVVLILNGIDISCNAAPAILVQSAFDPEDGNASGVTIWLADGTTNLIDGSHSDDNDGALSSNVSLLIDGDGALEITADMEGIETTMHLTINGGHIAIVSDEDAINANEDGVSTITINGGVVYADSSAGTDGDGIDSNGYIVINGGTVYGFASGANSGLDSDLGTVINGGIVFAVGSMDDGVSASSDQTSISLSFSSALAKGTLVYVLDVSGNPVMAFRTLNSCSMFTYSSPDLDSDATYDVYVGGAVSGTFDAYGVCTSFTVTSAGVLQTNAPRSM